MFLYLFEGHGPRRNSLGRRYAYTGTRNAQGFSEWLTKIQSLCTWPSEKTLSADAPTPVRIAYHESSIFGEHSPSCSQPGNQGTRRKAHARSPTLWKFGYFNTRNCGTPTSLPTSATWNLSRTPFVGGDLSGPEAGGDYMKCLSLVEPLRGLTAYVFWNFPAPW
jgi:hypothetical protein